MTGLKGQLELQKPLLDFFGYNLHVISIIHDC